ncbi:MAG: response regulator transcription factor [Saprospiraceae bacterium]|nr:response regulator transcription factor [Saprospiraceae bacterium]
MAKIKLLYVEDELALANIVKDVLEDRGYEVLLISDGAKVIPALDWFQPEICILDIMLPNIDGYALGQELTKRIPDTPIIFLSAKNLPADVIKGFKNGGSDYMRKPFSIEELLVRIENQLGIKKAAPPAEKQKNEIRFGAYTFYPNKLLLSYKQEERRLTYREAELLSFFANHKNGIIEKKDLLLKVWGDDNLYNARNLDVYIARARELFSQDPKVEIITLRGLGYRFNVE